MGDSTSSHIVASSKLADIKVRTHNSFIGTTGEVVTSIDGTVVVVVTKEFLSVDAAQKLITRIGGTDRAIITDNVFRPITVEGARRGELNTTIKGAGKAIVTIRSIDANRSIVGAISRWGATLLLGKVGGITARGSIVDRKLDDKIFAGLGAIETIANAPVSVAFKTRFWASIDFSGVARFGPVGLVSKRARNTSSNFSSVHNVDLDMSSSKSIGRTVARQSFVAANAVDGLARRTLERVIS